MQIDPKVSYWLNVALGILMAVALGTLSFSDFVDAGTAKKIASGAAMAAFVLNMVLHGYSSSVPGPGMPPVLAPTPSLDMNAMQKQAQQSAPKMMIALFIAAAILLPGVSHAQTVAPRPQPPRLTGNPIVDFAPKAAASSGAPSAPGYDAIGGKLQEVAKDVIDRAIADLTAASLDAKGTADLISQPCWDAQVAFLKLLPAEWPTPPTEVGPALAIQIGRDLRRALTSDSQGSLKVACAALFGDELQQAGKLFSILGLRTAGLALGLPL